MWYEVVRFPKTDVLQCLNITVDSNAEGPLNVGLKYVTVFGKERKAYEEIITFPWDKYTANSVFILKYDNIFVTYKVLRASTDLVLLCGFCVISPVPLLKGLSRQPKLTPQMKSNVMESLKRLKITNFVYWTEQSPSKCSSSVRLIASLALSILSLYIKFLDTHFLLILDKY